MAGIDATDNKACPVFGGVRFTCNCEGGEKRTFFFYLSEGEGRCDGETLQLYKKEKKLLPNSIKFFFSFRGSI